jgi:hypothetical protein
MKNIGIFSLIAGLALTAYYFIKKAKDKKEKAEVESVKTPPAANIADQIKTANKVLAFTLTESEIDTFSGYLDRLDFLGAEQKKKGRIPTATDEMRDKARILNNLTLGNLYKVVNFWQYKTKKKIYANEAFNGITDAKEVLPAFLKRLRSINF